MKYAFIFMQILHKSIKYSPLVIYEALVFHMLNLSLKVALRIHVKIHPLLFFGNIFKYEIVTFNAYFIVLNVTVYAYTCRTYMY